VFTNPDANPDFDSKSDDTDPDHDLNPKTKPQLETGQATIYESLPFSGAVVFVSITVSVSVFISAERSHRELRSARLLGKVEQ